MVLEREILEREESEERAPILDRGGGVAAAPVVLRDGGGEQPATDAQLIRIGRRLGLRYEEAEALLEVLRERAGIEGGAGGQEGLDEEGAGDGEMALRSFPPRVMARLQAMPGLFLLTDGMTFGRLERAVSRVRGLCGARRRLRRLGEAVERAAAFEGRLLRQVARALRDRGSTSGRGA